MIARKNEPEIRGKEGAEEGSKLISKIRKKLRSRSGESIAETLVALLISSLALIMLAEAMSASSGVIKKSRDKLGEYNTNEESMVKASGSVRTGTVTIKDASGNTLNSYSVNYYINSAFGKTPVVEYKHQNP